MVLKFLESYPVQAAIRSCVFEKIRRNSKHTLDNANERLYNMDE